MAFDFFDLEEEHFIGDGSVFISTPPLESSSLLRLKPQKSKLEQVLVDKFVIEFNSRGPFIEGRDSKIYKGTMRLKVDDGFGFDGGLVTNVAIKFYSQESLTGARKEVQIAKFTEGRSDFLKLFASNLEDERCPCTVWEWIDGWTLDRALKQQSSIITQELTTKIMKQILTSLSFLHIVHCIAHHDLKPQNILLTKDFSRIILIDFGDSKILNGGGMNSLMIPLDEGIGLGTLAYTAPELLTRKCESYSPAAADIYSFGVLIFYLINSGRINPFASLLPHRSVQLILTVQKGFFAGGFNPEVSADSPLFSIIQACLSTNPKYRPTCSDLINMMEKID